MDVLVNGQAPPCSVDSRHAGEVAYSFPLLRDWSGIEDPGKRFETFVACHLLKAVDAWNDLGLGKFELRYLRDKQKREVDFVVVREGEPWFLVEAKLKETRLSESLAYFQNATAARHAFSFCDSNGGPLCFDRDLDDEPHDPNHPAPGPFAKASDDAIYGFCVGRCV